MTNAKLGSKANIFIAGFFHLPIVVKALSNSFDEINVYSSYPKHYLSRNLTSSARIHSYVLKEILGRFPAWMFYDKPHQLSQVFQQSIKRPLQGLDSDITIGWAGHSLSVAKICAEKDIPFVLERGSTHIRWQYERLTLAYKNSGLPINYAEVPSENFILNQEEEYKLAKRIHVPTALCKRSFVKYSGHNVSKKIRLTRYGFQFPSTLIDEKNPEQLNEIKFLFVGTLSVRKGFFDFCSITNNIVHPNAHFTAVGKFTQDTKKIIEKFEPRCEILPSKSKYELFELYKTHHVLIVCSYEEGLSMVIPEAISQGMIVVGTFDSGVEEYVEDGVNGFILEAGNVEMFTDKINELIKNPDLIGHMGSNINSRTTTQNFDNYAHQYKSSISELL